MTNEEIEMVKKLMRHGAFHLTGSRYWNKLAPDLIELEANTDCDFAAEHDAKIVDYLIGEGFTLKNGGIDPNMVDQYNLNDGQTALVLFFGSVQVIFKKGLDVYLAVQSAISPEFYKRFLWKKHNTVENIRHLLYTLYNIEAENKKRRKDAEFVMDWT